MEKVGEHSIEQKYRGNDTGQNDHKHMNYYVIHGTSMGSLVKADSKLAKEIHHQLFVKSTNFQGIVCVPRDFADLRGHDGKITKTNLTDPYAFKFGVDE